MMSKSPPATRSARLRELVEHAEREAGPTFDVPYQGGRKTLRRITVEAALPLYRIQNGRTHSAQTAYLENHPQLPHDFFDDPEDPKVQQAQEDILLTLIDQRDLAADLQDRGQQTPIVLTIDGFVLDGNRRMASLRKHGATHISAVVLPETAQAKDLYETEIELQMQRDTKADYSWVDRAIHIDYGITSLAESVDVVARRMRMSKEDVMFELSMLALARMYLVWLGHPGQFHYIPITAGGNSEQAFRELASFQNNPKFLRQIPEERRRFIRETCFSSIKEKEGYQEVRDIIKQMTRNMSKVTERLTGLMPEQMSLEGIPASGQGQSSFSTNNDSVDETQSDPLLALAGESAASVAEVSVITNAARDLAQVRAVIGDISAEERDAKKQPLQRLQRVLRDLRQVELVPDSPELSHIARTLDEINLETERLTNKVAELSKV